MIDPLLLHIDNTTLKSTHTCSTQTLLKHHHGFVTPTKRAELEVGTAVHECLATYLKGGSVEESLAVLEKCYGSVPPIDPELTPKLERLMFPNVRAIIQYWMETHPIDKLPFVVHPDLVEVGFAYPLTDDGLIVMCGRLDALVTSKTTGDWYVLDHKTTGYINEDWINSFKMDSQMSGYIWASSKTLGKPVTGAYINGIELKKLPGSSRKCYEHGLLYKDCAPAHSKHHLMTVTRSQPQLDEWRRTAISLAKRFRALKDEFGDLDKLHQVRTQGQFDGRACVWCDFQDFCAAGRPVSQLKRLFEISMWEPFTHAFPTQVVQKANP